MNIPFVSAAAGTGFNNQHNFPVRKLDELQEWFYWCTDNNNSLVITGKSGIYSSPK